MRGCWMIPVMNLLLGLPLFSQGGQPKPQFDVTSVKPAAPEGAGRGYLQIRGGPGTNDPTRITYTYTSMRRLIETAYRLKQYEVVGPDWIDSQYYDIVAKVPEGATREQVQTMLQNLLVERFRLETHRESRDVAAYNLVLGKKGIQIKNGKIPETALPGFNYATAPGRMTLTAKKLPMRGLTGLLSQQLGRPVLDSTGLTDTYDFVLEFLPESSSGGHDALVESQAPPLPIAIQEQLGLKLEPTRSTIQIFVVDKATKTPSEN
jgi:uncharacterized protein (TIGR03435 family)